MELVGISEAFGPSDVFWISGDAVFQRFLPAEFESLPVAERALFRLSQIKANLNAHLLLHHRLALADTSFLLHPSLKHLIETEPEYAAFLRDGILVPVMRDGVASFKDVAKVVREGKNWHEPELIDMDASASLLDSIEPRIAASPTSENRELVNSIGETHLLTRDYWLASGLGELSGRLLEFVPLAMKRNSARNYRQTEFWEFAREAESAGFRTESQMIRTTLSFISYGVMAKNLNLAFSVPASQHDQAAAFYGLGTIIDDESLTAEEEEWLEGPPAHLLPAISLLGPSDIYSIRASKPFKSFRDVCESSSSTPQQIESARRTYLEVLSTMVDVTLAGRFSEWSTLQACSRWLKWSAVGSPAAGVLSSLGTTKPGIGPGWGAATAATLVFIRDKVETRSKNLQLESTIAAKRRISELDRDAHIVGFLYGPTSRNSWGSQTDMGKP